MTTYTKAKWVQLSLDLHDQEALAADVYYICHQCGPSRARLRWNDEGDLISCIGDSLCAHIRLALTDFND